MNAEWLAILSLCLAAIPAGLFALNMLVYRPPPRTGGTRARGVSVLIPARNEERNIGETVRSVLASQGVEFEVVVLDDASTDRTAEIMHQIAGNDTRARVETAPPLPAGWCGKQHACHVLASRARFPLLVFMDADVRLAADALARMASFMDARGVDLASGVPRQIVGSFSESLLLPMIHFVLLGYLPMHAMRLTRMAAMSAGCGQLFIARRDAYERSGGHARLRDSLHDGVKLPRAFRTAGFSTDLFDATEIASCRMYETNAETWRGLGKNATEGLGAPKAIVPMSLLLFGGHVLPFVVLGCAPWILEIAMKWAAGAALLSLTPRVIAAWRFRQPLSSALLHPIGVLGLLAIQWHTLARCWFGKPAEWKGRAYKQASGAQAV